MKFIILAILLLFIVILRYVIRKGDKEGKDTDAKFWERENEANNVRRKPLDDLEYINVPLEELPLDFMSDDETVADCVRQIKELSKEQIVNFTGLTNTDLKMKYGVANLPFLSSCDERYTTLVQLLQKWADRLWEKGCRDEAAQVLEYEVKIRADIGSAYRKLAKYYRLTGKPEKIEELVKVVEGLDTISKDAIIRDIRGTEN